jgi:hypothetical protein
MMVARIARRSEQIVPIDDLEAGIDGPNALDEFGLQG